MAARSGATSDSESSSSSDAEELARCREAAMPAWGLEQRPRGAEKPRADAADIPPASQPSLRHRADEHEQDGNELQTTPEFRAHVAKKLGALLDSAITIWEAGKEPGKPGLPQEASRDDGFRLFFTSIPRDPGQEASPRPRRKRQPSSSSGEDSDEQRRCREAAVSASDILQESAIHGPAQGEDEAKKKKKKLNKKARKVASIATETVAQEQEEEVGRVNGARVSPGTKRKKRKKKARKALEAPSSPPAAGTAATPTD
uniref:Protein CUSTOS n=1 Tax=Oryctolagus cuniculus TaxID=9986 RepID=G1U4S3_RABIT|nr:protein CUSTOS isoform X2 [Oryctolagus cuniculus]